MAPPLDHSDWLQSLPPYYHRYTPSGQPHNVFLLRAMNEGEQQAIRHLKGPFYDAFAERLTSLEADLHAINPNFTPEHLLPDAYHSAATQRTMPASYTIEARQLEELSANKNSYVTPVGDATYASDEHTVLPTDILTIPPYAQEGEGSRACVGACARMILGALSGQQFLNVHMREATVKKFGSEQPPDDSGIFSMFASDIITQEYGVVTTPVRFTGMNLARIVQISRAYKEKNPDGRVFCALTLQSETRWRSNIWHMVVLTAVEQGGIVCHDPSYQGKAGRRLPKQDFMRLWACAYNSGWLVFADRG